MIRQKKVKHMTNSIFLINKLSLILSIYIVTLGSIIIYFAWQYMHGDRQHKLFLARMMTLIVSVLVMVNLNNLALFYFLWIISSYAMIQLIQHKSHWKQAKYSAQLAMKYFISSGLFLGFGFAFLIVASGNLNFSTIIQCKSERQSIFIILGLAFTLCGVIIQSALIPFHTWLISSANAPTPTSALMHAGIINGGGIILARLGCLYIQYPLLLEVLFSVGLISAILGTVAKLAQNDVKRMLAFSTVSQMGFMMIECGLGLFSIAIAHICWHGFFKAYLFLSSSNAPNTFKNVSQKVYSWTSLFLSTCVALSGCILLCVIANSVLSINNSTFVVLSIAFIFFTEISISLIKKNDLSSIFRPALLILLIALFYGLSINVIEYYFQNTPLFYPQPLNIIYVLGACILIGSWILLHIAHLSSIAFLPDSIKAKLYVWLINFSQPHPKTITALRSHYQI